MTDFNYGLSYNGNFRWQDFRSSNSHFTIGAQVRLDIVTFDNNSQTLLHIHNYHTTCEAQTNKHVKQTLSCFVGEGRIEHEIFGMMKEGNPASNPDSFLTSEAGLWVCFKPQVRLVFLVASADMFAGTRYTKDLNGLWHFIHSLDLPTKYLFLAIPLTLVNAR